jgi:hypothetical protein
MALQPEPRKPLTDYQRAVNSFIDDAERKANRMLKKRPELDVDAASDLWSRIYHEEMNRLTEAAGVRRLVG